MIVQRKRTGRRLALAGGAVLIIVVVSVLGISLRWFRAPYPSLGKQIAWSLGYPEAGYNFAAVVPGKLYRSGSPDEHFIRYLHEVYGIRHIVSLTGPVAAHETARQLGIRVTVFGWIPSEPPPVEELRAMLGRLDEPLPVLLHCSSGSDRAGYAIVAYRVLKQHWSFDRAVEEMKDYWHDPALYPKVHRALPALIQQMR